MRRKTVIDGSHGCYGKMLRDLPKGVLRRGRNLYYRHTIPINSQRLMNREEIWRTLRTDSLPVALRRLPSVVARIETEIEHARAIAGMSVDATLIRPLSDDYPEPSLPITPVPIVTVLADRTLTLSEAYRKYIDDPTRAWTANTREAYETSQRLAIAVLGAEVPVSSISRTHQHRIFIAKVLDNIVAHDVA